MMIIYKAWYKYRQRKPVNANLRLNCVIGCEGWFLLWIIPLYVRETSWNWR